MKPGPIIDVLLGCVLALLVSLLVLSTVLLAEVRS